VTGSDGSSRGDFSDRLLTAAEVGELLQVNSRWVLDAARRNAIPHIRLGRYVRFRRVDLEAWLLEQRRGPGKSAAVMRGYVTPRLSTASMSARRSLTFSRRR
jgi:excisionase family DNA binding protein